MNGALRLGYNTSGFARTRDVVGVVKHLAAIGYAGIELTLDARHFHPHHSSQSEREAIASALREHGMGIVIGTGARYVLSEVKHEPGLVSAAPEAREKFLKFLEDSLELAPALGAQVVMLHSGYPPRGVEPERAWDWAISGSRRLAERAAARGVALAFEFHPDMFVRTLADYERLAAAVASKAFRLTLDIGHVVCTDTRPVREVVQRCHREIANVHLEDVKGRKHVHLPIGEGDVDFAEVFSALRSVGYQGLVNPEFNTDDLAVDEVTLAKRTFEHLRGLGL